MSPLFSKLSCNFIVGISIGAFLLLTSAANARDAAFIAPNTAGSGMNNEALRIEPKSEVDLGETLLNVPKRTTIFFVNQTTLPVNVEKLTVNGDGNVRAEIATDDCSKQKTIASQSRCSVEISVTPTTPGTWSVDALMTHNGLGRISRAKLSGKTSGSADSSKNETGLSPSTKESPPINFGDVDAGTSKVVRSTLMMNDSGEPITIYSIDVIEAGSDLTKINQGCAVDMELKPGESCPITLVWAPQSRGTISTDLIIRHSGRVGFALIPVRGIAKGEAPTASTSKNNPTPTTSTALIPPPAPVSIDKAAFSVAESALQPPAAKQASQAAQPATTATAGLRLIGTVGTRAILLKADGSTVVASIGDKLDIDDKPAALVSVGAKSVEITHNGEAKTLTLQAAKELVVRAQQSAAERAEKNTTNKTTSTETKTEGKK